MIRLLVIDDEKSIRDAVRIALIGDDYHVMEASTLKKGYTAIVEERPDVVVLDVHFGSDQTCHSLLLKLKNEKITIPIIVLSGAASAKEAVDAIRLGAFDFIQKPLSAEKLEVTIARALEAQHLRASLHSIVASNNRQQAMIGQSDGMEQVRTLIEQFAKKEVKVLINGETGTGKEVVANHIWCQSGRSDKPYIIVNSAAIPDTLIESELFGHVKGAFTGATNDQIGKIEMANGGTLFLDEIAELSERAQSKLLRFLENGEIQRVGGKKMQSCDVRLIAATSRDLESEVAAGRFRGDLFYRLNVARIVIPPLRDRPDDVAIIARHFITQFCRKHGETEKELDSDAVACLCDYTWPGNVRELRNVSERIVLLPQTEIKAGHLTSILPQAKKVTAEDQWMPQSRDDILPLKEFKKQIERSYIQSVLTLSEQSVTAAAKILGLSRGYLYQKLNELDISYEKE